MRHLRNKTILLADHNAADVAEMKRILGQFGLSECLHVVGDGDEAIHFLAGDGCYADRSKYPHPALLILDLEIPPRNGEAVIEWIRRQCLLQDLFVVIFSNKERCF